MLLLMKKLIFLRVLILVVISHPKMYKIRKRFYLFSRQTNLSQKYQYFLKASSLFLKELILKNGSLSTKILISKSSPKMVSFLFSSDILFTYLISRLFDKFFVFECSYFRKDYTDLPFHTGIGFSIANIFFFSISLQIINIFRNLIYVLGKFIHILGNLIYIFRNLIYIFRNFANILSDLSNHPSLLVNC